MAKKDTEVKTGELVTQAQTSQELALPDFIEVGDATGTEGITRDDIQIARLAIAQGISPQVTEGSASYIEELRVGHMFNTLNGQIYGKGPIEITFIRRDNPRWVEFDEDRNVIDRDVPFDDPRTQWRGKEKPIATQFYDYLAVILDNNDIVAISLAKSGIKIAKRLNGMLIEPINVPTTNGMTKRMVPIYAKRFRCSVMQLPNGQGGTFGAFKFEYAGLNTDRELYQSLKMLTESMKDKIININESEAAAESGDEGASSTAAPAQDVPTDM